MIKLFTITSLFLISSYSLAQSTEHTDDLFAESPYECLESGQKSFSMSLLVKNGGKQAVLKHLMADESVNEEVLGVKGVLGLEEFKPEISDSKILIVTEANYNVSPPQVRVLRCSSSF